MKKTEEILTYVKPGCTSISIRLPINLICSKLLTEMCVTITPDIFQNIPDLAQKCFKKYHNLIYINVNNNRLRSYKNDFSKGKEFHEKFILSYELLKLFKHC